MQRAFSLVELSIVLVILGLLTGGILAGQSLIRAAELRAVVSEYQRYVTAVQSFRDRYMAIPGDMASATRFWGAAHATPATCKTTASTTTATCDGDGDGTVEYWATSSNEKFRFWQQLANAGLIEGSYVGITSGATNDYTSVAAYNVPPSKLSNAAWDAAWAGDDPGDGTWYRFAGQKGHRLMIGAAMANNGPWGSSFKPEEVWNIDTKVDDGKPAVGKVMVIRYNTCTNGTGVSDYAAQYTLTSTSISCSIEFVNAF